MSMDMDNLVEMMRSLSRAQAREIIATSGLTLEERTVIELRVFGIPSREQEQAQGKLDDLTDSQNGAKN